jgi:alpha-ketoglutarate-dependent taurine dioxygenase
VGPRRDGGPSPIGGPAAWTADDAVIETVTTTFADLSSDVVDDLAGIAHDAVVPAPPAAAVTARDGVRPFAALVRERVFAGSGVLVLRGLPVDPDDHARCEAVLTALLGACGTVLPQNVAGDSVYTVIDRSDPRGSFYGGSRATGALLHHTDQAAAPEPLLAHLLTLWCLHPARSGGETIVASGHALHDALVQTDSRFAESLYDRLPFARDDDGTSDAEPVRSPVFRADGDQVRVRYNEYFVQRGVERTGSELSVEQRDALATCADILATRALDLVLPLEAGDLLLVDNRVVMHNRTAYEDGDDVAHKRRLLRGWARLAEVPARAG